MDAWERRLSLLILSQLHRLHNDRLLVGIFISGKADRHVRKGFVSMSFVHLLAASINHDTDTFSYLRRRYIFLYNHTIAGDLDCEIVISFRTTKVSQDNIGLR